MKKVLKRKNDFKPFVKKSNGEVTIMMEYQPISKDMGWCLTHTFTGNPSIDEIKSFVNNRINKQTENKILSGLTYNGKIVWLSMENQQNYEADYILATKTDGKNLPIVIKIGDNSSYEYITFHDIDEYTEFYLKVVSHIRQCIQEGWANKDAIDWTLYQ